MHIFKPWDSPDGQNLDDECGDIGRKHWADVFELPWWAGFWW